MKQEQEQGLEWEEITCEGSISPPPLFGHTSVVISKTKVAFFGGAMLENEKITMTNRTFIYNMFKNEWSEIKGINK